MIVKKFRCLLNVCARSFSVKVSKRLVTTESCKVSPKKISVNKRKLNQEFVNYFKSTPELSAIHSRIPEEYLIRRRANGLGALYLVDPAVAKDIVTLIKPYLYDESNVLIDSNAGLGLLAKELLDRGVKTVRLFESSPIFRYTLKDLMNQYDGRIELFNKDIFSLWKLAYQDRIDNMNRVEQVLNGVQRKNWCEDPPLTIIGVMQELHFLKYLLFSLLTNSDIILYGRTEVYAMLTPKLYQHLIATPKDSYYMYRSFSVLFQLLFDYELLGSFPRKAYLPWPNISKSERIAKTELLLDPDKLYFLRINLKKDLLIPREQLTSLYQFVRQSMSSRKTKVIAHLERWVPNSGYKLMLLDILSNKQQKVDIGDITIFTQFGELTPTQILNLFKEFISWPEVQDSPFAASVEEVLVKLTTHPDQIAVNSIVEDSEIGSTKSESSLKLPDENK